MKKLLLILLFPLLLQAQTGWQGWGKWHDYLNRPESGITLDSEVQTYINSLTTPLSEAQQIKINDFVLALKDSLSVSSLTSLFDVLYLHANETEEAAITNIARVGFNATLVNAPTFTQYEGFTGDGLTKYINTNWNGRTDAITYSLNSASFGIYFRTNTTASNYEISGTFSTTADGGNANRVYIGRPNGYNETYFSAVNSVANDVVSSERLNGVYIATRTAVDLHKLYVNGVEKMTGNQVSNKIPNQNIFLLALHFGTGAPLFYENDQIAISFIGRGFDPTEIRKVTNCIENYMDSLGKGVIP